jgi:hypothetical protein
MGIEPSVPRVEVVDPGSAGIAYISQALMSKAVANSPELARKMRGSVAMWASDYRTGTTVSFEGDRVAIDGVCHDDAWIRVEGGAIMLAKLGGGVHDIDALLKRKVRVRGVLRHPLFALRLRRLLDAAQPAE